MGRRALRAVAWLAMAMPLHAAADSGGEWRVHLDPVAARQGGPLAAAEALAPGIAPPPRDGATAELAWHGQWPLPVRAFPSLALAADLQLGQRRREGMAAESSSRVNELHLSGEWGTWHWSAGKKIVGWDVGYGYRPNDVVEQETRRTLLAVTPEGRPLLQLERFDADTSTAIVWVNPERYGAADDASRGALESALAARWYRRDGPRDWHLFSRIGRHTGSSVGAALAWVATDELEFHASLRALQRHDGWRFDAGAGNAVVGATPWRQATLGGAAQALLGASWTGRQQQSFLVEWWHDGAALDDRSWNDAWSPRNAALIAFAGRPGLPSSAVLGAAGNLAWQAMPVTATNLRRDNLFVRAAWQPERWLLAVDALLTPHDHGRVVTLSAQWQGDRWRWNAAWRVAGGAGGSLFAQLPVRTSGLLAATWAF